MAELKLKQLVCCLLVAISCMIGCSKAAIVSTRLHINYGLFQTVDTTFLPSYAFNEDPFYSSRNSVIRLVEGDTLRLAVINNTSSVHGFAVPGMLSPQTILAQDSILLVLIFPSSGVFVYHDSQAFPKYTYMGAAGFIAVAARPAEKQFFWNIKEHQKSWNDSLDQGQTVAWASYKPDYFTINGLSKPDLQADSTAAIMGSVGDTLRIYVANSGRSVHSLHFHGFHVRVVFASKHPEMQDWIKDTVPIESLEGMILEMVPDKVGMYPTHDHNLTAIIGGGYYPNGMFIMMEIN